MCMLKVYKNIDNLFEEQAEDKKQLIKKPYSILLIKQILYHIEFKGTLCAK